MGPQGAGGDLEVALGGPPGGLLPYACPERGLGWDLDPSSERPAAVLAVCLICCAKISFSTFASASTVAPALY